ncbi:STAS domain-containing protein [Prescottella agglutinans]|uniref:STAS domain-containing protein n=1 Tax=Prescottella agglutinans TaxID=1644129 RepID=UPI003D99C087
MRVDVLCSLPIDGSPDTRLSRSVGTAVVTVFGDVDEQAISRFAPLRYAVETAERTLIVDLTHVGFLGIAGAQLLAAENDRADTRRVNLRVVPGGRAVTRCLEATGLLSKFRCFPSVESAMTDG